MVPIKFIALLRVEVIRSLAILVKYLMRCWRWSLYISAMIFSLELFSKMQPAAGNKNLPVILFNITLLIDTVGMCIAMVPFQSDPDNLCFLLNSVIEGARKRNVGCASEQGIDVLLLTFGTLTFVVLGVPLISSTFPDQIHTLYLPVCFATNSVPRCKYGDVKY